MKTAVELAKEYALKCYPKQSSESDLYAPLRNIIEEIFLVGYNEASKWRNSLEEQPENGQEVIVKELYMSGDFHHFIACYIEDAETNEKYFLPSVIKNAYAPIHELVFWKPIE